MPAWIPAAVGAAASLLGGERANKQNLAEAQRNRQFQERMRNTSWQAAVEDMRKAGINPAVAYARGGAAAPSGSMASVSDAVTPAVSSAMQARQMTESIKLLEAQVEKAQAEAVSAAANARLDNWKSSYMLGIDMNRKRQPIMELTEAEIAERVASASRQSSMARISGVGGEAAGVVSELMPGFGRIGAMAGRGASSVAGLVEYLERVARMRDDAVQSAVGMSREAVFRLLAAVKRSRSYSLLGGQ